MSLNIWWFTSGVECWILYWVFYRNTKKHFPLTLLFTFTSTHFSNIRDGYKSLKNMSNSNEIFKKYVAYDNIKIHKKSQIFTLSLEENVLEEIQGSGGQIELLPSLLRICISWSNKIFWFSIKKCWCQQGSRGVSRDSYISWDFL